MKKIMHFLFLSCLKATELMEKKLHFNLSYKEKLQLKVHKMMCDACSNYEKHNMIIEKSIENLEININEDTNFDLPEFEYSIIEKLAK